MPRNAPIRAHRAFLNSQSRIERGDKIDAAARGHWAIENKLHWVLDVSFREDLSRLRAGHGANNVAVVRRVADERSIKRRPKRASWDSQYLWRFSGRYGVNLDSLPCLRRHGRDRGDGGQRRRIAGHSGWSGKSPLREAQHGGSSQSRPLTRKPSLLRAIGEEISMRQTSPDSRQRSRQR
jgi:hypothetical protein